MAASNKHCNLSPLLEFKMYHPNTATTANDNNAFNDRTVAHQYEAVR